MAIEPVIAPGYLCYAAAHASITMTTLLTLLSVIGLLRYKTFIF